MTTINTDDSPVSHPAAAKETKEQEEKPKKYPYLELLHQLQAISAAKFNTYDDDEEEDDSDLKNNNTTTSTSSKEEVEWDLSTDAQLATLLHEFTSHIQKRTYHVSSQIRHLQNSVNQVGITVGLVQHDIMQMSNEICMEQVVGEDDDDDDENDNREGAQTNNDDTHDDTNNNNIDDDDDDDSSADIARLEAEEKAAIQNGVKALSLFFDPKRKRSSMQQQQDKHGSSNSNNNNIDEGIITTSDTNTAEETNIIINTTITDGEENVIGENCYFYPAADADVFNSRPLPFIVGSREFMESSCSGGDGEFDRIED